MLTKKLKRGDSVFETRPTATFPYISKIKIPNYKPKYELKLDSQALKQQIKTRTQPRTIKFDIRIGARDDKSLEMLAKATKFAKKTQKLDLDISSLESLAKLHKISEEWKGLTSLTTLNIDLSFCYYLDDSVIFKLSRALKRLPSLINIKLELSSGVHRITDSGLYNLSTALKHLPLLQNVHFKFSLCHEIADKGIVHIAQSLKRLVCLKGLALNFFDCPKLGDLGLQSIGQLLKKHKGLRRLQLEFHKCNDLTDAGLEYIIKGLEGYESLQSLYLSFFDCEKISKTGERRIQECRSQLIKSKNTQRSYSLEGNQMMTMLNDLKKALRTDHMLMNDIGENYEMSDGWLSEDEVDLDTEPNPPRINRTSYFPDDQI